MKNTWLFILILVLFSCKNEIDKKEVPNDFVLAFGSCNNQNLPNVLWNEIMKNKPDLFIWGGDIIYSDGIDMDRMKKNYKKLKKDTLYQNFTSKVRVIGTWDDHDYGLNDGGYEYEKKDSVQQLLLDFFDVDSSDNRRKRRGIYFSELIDIGEKSIKIIVLDTRYFRTNLTVDSTGTKNYIPNIYGDGSMLGKDQWNWFEKELNSSNSDFNIIISSIQFLSKEHGFETWGNMPHEVDKMKEIIAKSNAKGVIILSGDRHIAEISKDSINKMKYPLIDFTSSGLTHSYSSFKGEPNMYRVTDVVSKINFGILRFNFQANQVNMEIRGERNVLYQDITQKY